MKITPISEKPINVLLIEGRARQVLPMSKSLKELGCIVTTYNSSKLDPGYASRYPQRKLLRYFDAKNHKKTYEAIYTELIEYNYDLVIPMNDDVAIILAKNKKELEYITTVVVNDWDVVQYSIDKLITMKVCMENNLPCPITFLNKEDFLSYSNKIAYPLVVKPRTGYAAVGFYVAETKDDVLEYLEKAEIKFGPCLIQEYIPQTDLQYKAEIYIDNKGKMKAACVFSKIRWYPTNGGSSTLNKTVDRPDIVADCLALLEKICWRGYADVDLIQDPRDGKAKIMEINPRITGSVKICFDSGVNFSKLILQDFLDIPVDSAFSVKLNTYLRYMHTDILWFLKSPERFKCNPSWFNFKNCSDQLFSWNDPWPFFAFTLQGFSKIVKDLKKRKI